MILWIIQYQLLTFFLSIYEGNLEWKICPYIVDVSTCRIIYYQYVDTEKGINNSINEKGNLKNKAAMGRQMKSSPISAHRHIFFFFFLTHCRPFQSTPFTRGVGKTAY